MAPLEKHVIHPYSNTLLQFLYYTFSIYYAIYFTRLYIFLAAFMRIILYYYY
jgi:hypothetical protein